MKKLFKFITSMAIFRVFLCVSMLMIIFPEFIMADTDVKKSVVKIFTVKTKSDYAKPWDKDSPEIIFGSGCVINGNRILTNAHVVSDQTLIQVRRFGQAKKHKARIIAVSHETDLALLTVDDQNFFQGIKPLSIGGLPEIQQEVVVYGFPEGGDSLSITKGIISRIEHQKYVHSSKSFLAIQIDAAVNHGNSGGPVISNGFIVGVAMQNIQDSQNINFIVPTPIINHFLTDIKDGNYDGIPEDGICIQPMENNGIKKRFGLKAGQTGGLVYYVIPGSPADGIIKPKDILLSVDGHLIADDCTVEFRADERTSCAYYTQQHQFGENVIMEILRNGKKQHVSIKLNKKSHDLVSRERYDLFPTYYIYGGLVFSPLTENYLKAWGEKWENDAPNNMMSLFSDGLPTSADEQVIILSNVLPHNVNKGYQNLSECIISEVNGQKIHNLQSMVRIIAKSNENPFVEFKTKKGIYIVLDRKAVESSQDEILQLYDVPKDRSADLSGIWRKVIGYSISSQSK